jgi:hypothetical protein
MNSEISALRVATNALDKHASTFSVDYYQALKINEGLTYYGLSILIAVLWIRAIMTVLLNSDTLVVKD